MLGTYLIIITVQAVALSPLQQESPRQKIYTDDNGTYFFPTRDFHPPQEIVNGKVDQQEFLSAHKSRIRKISDKRATVISNIYTVYMVVDSIN
jgi:hypothetical protein